MSSSSNQKRVSSIVNRFVDIVKFRGTELNMESMYYISRRFKEKVTPCSKKVSYYLPLTVAGEMLIAKIAHTSENVIVGVRDVHGNEMGGATIDSLGDLTEYRITSMQNSHH
jgi:hypothetical protein